MDEVSVKLEKEIEELNKMIFTEETSEEHPEQIDTEEEEITADLSDEVTQEVEDFEELTEVEVVEEEKPKKRVSWKKRYQDLQSFADSRKNVLESQVRGYKEEMLALKEQVDSLKDAIAEKHPTTKMNTLFSQEDIDMLGEDTVNSLSSATERVLEERLNPLKSELQKEKERRREAEKKQLINDKKVAYSKFLGKLGELAPNYESLNKDVGFNQWLALGDEHSGYPRSKLLLDAERSGNVFEVARMFNDYNKLINPNEEVLRAQVAPNSSSSAATPMTNRKKKVWTTDEIDIVYEKIRTGKIPSDKAQKFKDVIQDAVLDGRVQ